MLQLFSEKSAYIKRFLYLRHVISLFRLLTDIVLEAFGFISFVVNLENSTYNRNGRETLPLGIYIPLHIKEYKRPIHSVLWIMQKGNTI